MTSKDRRKWSAFQRRNTRLLERDYLGTGCLVLEEPILNSGQRPDHVVLCETGVVEVRDSKHVQELSHASVDQGLAYRRQLRAPVGFEVRGDTSASVGVVDRLIEEEICVYVDGEPVDPCALLDLGVEEYEPDGLQAGQVVGVLAAGAAGGYLASEAFATVDADGNRRRNEVAGTVGAVVSALGAAWLMSR